MRLDSSSMCRWVRGLAAMIAAVLLLCPRTGRAGELTVFPARVEPARATLTIASATDLPVIAPLIEGFQNRETGLTVHYDEHNTQPLHEAATAACRGTAPSADLVMSSAVDLMVKLVNDGCARAHASPATDALPGSANWRNELFGLTREPVVMVLNRAAFPAAVPADRFALIDLLRAEPDRFAGKVATYDIATSGVGYLFAFADAQQASTYGRLIESLGRVRPSLVCCTAEILDGVAQGRFLVGYNVLGSYAAARADPRLVIVEPADYTLVLTRAAMIPKGAAAPAIAAAFLDFALSQDGQALLAKTAFLKPSAPGEALSSSANLHRPIALTPALLVGLDTHKRRRFLDHWSAAMRR